MAGHSKFKNIQHRKGAQDKKRAKVFTKVGREIIVAAKIGGGDPDANPRLRTAISAARAVNMPNDRIKKAIDTAAGSTDGDDYEEIRYEGYGPGGVAVIVESLTDNRNRTVSELRLIFAKNGGNLGDTGSVNFMFDRVGEIVYPASIGDADSVFEAAAEAGAENVESDDETHNITCSVDDFATVRDALEKHYGEAKEGGLIWQPNVMTPIDEDQASTLLNLVELIEDNDDVQTVTTNADIDDAVMERLGSEG